MYTIPAMAAAISGAATKGVLLLRLLLLAIALFAVALFVWRRRHLPHRGRKCRSSATERRPTGFQSPKPPWVAKEVLRLKALMPEHGCRKVAEVFNHLYRAKCQMTVGHTFVAERLRGREAEILRLRQKLKHHVPRPLARNLVWAMDLTFVPTEAGMATVLGLLDHGTRACLALRQLQTKSSIALLRCLLDAVEAYGAPRALRTDNEAVFTSRLFRLGLLLFGIRHQRTAPLCPWQNGRIERFFRAFKEALAQWKEAAELPMELGADLAVFRGFYNFVRPHQHLGGRTPAMAWTGTAPSGRGRAAYVSEWGGALAGFLFPT